MNSINTLCRVLFATAVAAVSLNAAESRETAPPFSLINSKGATVNLSQFQGKVVLLDF
jgi:cytochrome oxidase Cu insertion factor (SCO1/SenC/PrrC family)